MGRFLAFCGRVFLFLALLSMALIAAAAALAPVLLVCSDHNSWICSHFFALPTSMWKAIGGWYSRTIICPQAAETCDPRGVVWISSTQSAFQALFGFGVAIQFLGKLWTRCRNILRSLGPQLDSAFLSPEATNRKADEEYQAMVRVRNRRWTKRTRFWVSTTTVFAHTSFLLTALVAGNILILTFYDNRHSLYFSKSLSVAFALAPFVALAVLFAKYWIVTMAVGPALAPGHYWNSYRARRLEAKALAELDSYNGSHFFDPFVDLWHRFQAWRRTAPPEVAASTVASDPPPSDTDNDTTN